MFHCILIFCHYFLDILQLPFQSWCPPPPITLVMLLEFLLYCGGECGLCHVSCLEFIEFFLHGLIHDFVNVPGALKKKTYSVIRI